MRNFHWTVLLGIAAVIGSPTCPAAESAETAVSQAVRSAATKAEDTHDWLEAIAALDYKPQDFRDRLQDGGLAALYVNLKTQQQTLQSLRTYMKNPSPAIAASDNVQRLLAAIQSFYRDQYRQPWIGDEEAHRAPDAIVILGANPTVLQQRLAHALPIVQKFDTVPIVLSGGGRTIVQEAQTMHDYLKSHGVPCARMILETDSLDTVGNAVFSDFALAKKGIHEGRVLIVTSDFHAQRSLYLFRSILGSKFKIAVSAAPSNLERIDSELKQIAEARNDLLQWPALPEQSSPRVKNTCDVFFQTLLRHELYTSRWDLARRYAGQCQAPG